MDLSNGHSRDLNTYVYHIRLQDSFQLSQLLCLVCQVMLLPMPLQPVRLTIRSGFMVAETKNFHLCRALGIADSDRSAKLWTQLQPKSLHREG